MASKAGSGEARCSILLLVRSLEVGGAERQLTQLACGLRARGHVVSVALFYRRGPLIAELERAGISVIDLKKRGRWDVIPFFARFRRELRNVQPDVVYSFLGGANIVAALVRPVSPSFRLVWSIRASDMDLSKYDWLHRVAYALECKLSTVPDLIISNSRSGRDFAVAQGFPPERIAVVANGIDADRFRPDAARRKAWRKRWGIGDSEILVGVLSRLDPMKGYPVFLEAASIAAAQSPYLRFACIGSGPEERKLKRMAAHLGLSDRVVFTGFEPDPVAALNALDIACSPSLTEGFPNSIAEAMACGCPCVVTDAGDSADIVGDTGRVVPRADAKALATALLEERSSLTDRRAAQARARAVECFGLDSMVDRTAELLRNLRPE